MKRNKHSSGIYYGAAFLCGKIEVKENLGGGGDDVKKLTPKQQAFINEYLIDMNASQAALRAGYSEKTAFRAGQVNMQNYAITSEINKRLKEREKRTEITQDQVLKQLAKMAFYDIKDVITWEENNYNQQIIHLRSLDDVDGQLIESVKNTENGLEVKFASRSNALQLIMKHLGMLDERKALLKAKEKELQLKEKELEHKLNSGGNDDDAEAWIDAIKAVAEARKAKNNE